ncbi:MAG: DHA2 family efflux MFS transporter permease subunit [Sphingobium sp.]
MAATDAVAVPATERDEPAIYVKHKGLLTFAIMCATLIQVLDTTIANVALPHMQATLGASPESITWVLTSYIVAAGMATPLTGWLADRYGARNLLLLSVAAFVVASMLCGMATNLSQIVIFRVIQGISGAFLNPLGQAMLFDINPRSQQARAMTIYGTGTMVGPIIGPVLGGLLTDHFNWRWVFFVNVPVGLLCLALLWVLMPRKPLIERRFDLRGFAYLTIAVASLQMMLDRGQHLDWFSSPEILIECGIAVSFFWIFVIHLMSAKNPLYSHRLLCDRNLMVGMLFMAVINMVVMSGMALLPTFLQAMYGYSVVDTGLLLSTRGVGLMFAMWMMSRLMPIMDVRILIFIGFLLTGFSAWQMTGWSLDMDWRPIVSSSFLQGVGSGMIFLPLSLIAFTTLPSSLRTDASAMTNLARSVASSIAVAMASTLLVRNVQTSHADIGASVTSQSLPMDLNLTRAMGDFGTTIMSMLDGEINRQALMIAYLDDFQLLMIGSLIATPLILLLRPARPGAKAMHMGE